MINSLKINNFKGFDELIIPELSKVTLLGGRNNIGKTSILEAIFLLYDRMNPNMLLRQFATRGVARIPLNPENMWAPIFNKFDLNHNISITVKKNNKEETMLMKFNPSYKQSVPSEQEAIGSTPKISTDQKFIPSYSIDITYKITGEKDQKTHLIIETPGNLGMRIDNIHVDMNNHIVKMFDSKSNIKNNEDATRFGELDIIDKQDSIIEFLKIIEPRLKKISVITYDDISLLHGDIGLSRKIPINLMGAGVSRLLSIILGISTSKGGVVLIDEIENGIHYSVMANIWEAIVRAASEFDCQVIATTHSYEFLKAAHSGISEKMKKYFTYTRLESINNSIISKTFDHEMLGIALENELEVR